MSMPNAVVIIALSGRALAQSARRAGFTPLVIDAFGDEDAVAASADLRHATHNKRGLFDATYLIDRIAAWSGQRAADSPVVLGTGFEDRPEIIAKLEQTFPLAGCGSKVIQALKDPDQFCGALDRLRIPYPETRLTPPSDPEGWLRKRVGGSGGTHIAICTRRGAGQLKRRSPVYYQRRLTGAAVSVLAVASRTDVTVVAVSRQWTNPGPRQPFRYGGAVGPVAVPAQDADAMRFACDAVGKAFSLSGLVSFDFILGTDGPHLIEVNPRPGATLDIFDGAKGELFAAHVAARQGASVGDLVHHEHDDCRAAAYLYASRGPLTIGTVDWPEWSADRPPPGRAIAREAPIATVFGRATTPEAAEALCRTRLAALSEMLYGPQTDQGVHAP